MSTCNILAKHRIYLTTTVINSKTITNICDIQEEHHKTSRTFAISWEKLANHRAHLRSPGTSSQTIARIFDLLGQARKPSRAISSIQRHEIKIRHGSQLPEILINFLAEQLLRVGGRTAPLSCGDGLTFFAVEI